MNLIDLITTLAVLDISDFDAASRAIYGGFSSFDHWKLRRDLEALGHVRTDYTSRDVKLLSARLLLLPPDAETECRAVLGGARPTDLLQEMFPLTRRHQVSLETEPLRVGLPDRVLLTGTYSNISNLIKEVAQLRFEFTTDSSIPDCWRLVCATVKLNDILTGYLDPRNRHDQITNFPDGRPVFDPSTYSFRTWEQIRPTYIHNIVLIRWTRYQYKLALRSGSHWQLYLNPFPSDPFWAKWAVVQSAVLQHGSRPIESLIPFTGRNSLRVPSRCALPMDLHKVCCTCSGRPPIESEDWLEYEAVPPIIQHEVRERLAIGKLIIN